MNTISADPPTRQESTALAGPAQPELVEDLRGGEPVERGDGQADGVAGLALGQSVAATGAQQRPGQQGGRALVLRGSHDINVTVSYTPRHTLVPCRGSRIGSAHA